MGRVHGDAWNVKGAQTPPNLPSQRGGNAVTAKFPLLCEEGLGEVYVEHVSNLQPMGRSKPRICLQNAVNLCFRQINR